MAYQPGVPTGNIPLNADYLNLQENFQQLNDQWLVDHVPLTTTSGTPPNGYHLNIHLVPFSTTASNPPTNYPPITPPSVNGYGQVWSAQINDGINSDEALFFLSGGNRRMQLTSNFVPTISQNGATFLPGGLILNWGYKVSTGGANQTVTLIQKFPKNFFNAQATMIKNSSNVDAIYCQTSPGVAPVGGITTLQFRDTSSGNPFFWYAIGN